MEPPGKFKSDFLNTFSPIFGHRRRLWVNWSPRWNNIFDPGFFCASMSMPVVYGKIVWAMLRRFLIPKIPSPKFRCRYFRGPGPTYLESVRGCSSVQFCCNPEYHLMHLEVPPDAPDSSDRVQYINDAPFSQKYIKSTSRWTKIWEILIEKGWGG